MAGHSQFKNIMHRKGAQDAKRAKIFTKIIRELTVAVKTGLPDPQSNPRLRAALAAARAANMPRDNIDRAIKKAQGAEGSDDYVDMRYEGYGPGGVSVIVETLTDNRNRTASEIRAAFNKYGGSMGETGSVSFMFDHVGYILYPVTIASADDMFEAAVNAGADNIETTADGHEIYCASDDLNAVRQKLMDRFGDPEKSLLMWKPKTLHALNDDDAGTFMKFYDVLDDNDDVQHIWSNEDFSASFLKQHGEG